MPEKKTAQVATVQSLDRGLAILQAIAATEHPVSLGQVAELMDIDRSTAFRLLHTLKRRGFLAMPAGRKDYILGSTIWVLHHHYNWNKMLVKVASNQLKKLSSQTRETAHIAIREGKQALFVDCAAANHMVAVSSRIGEFLPLYCTAHGKALLADADEHELKQLFGTRPLRKYTEGTLSTLAEIVKDLSVINRQGFAIDDAEFSPDLRCIAAPIRVGGEIIGSIGISAPILRVTPEANRINAERVSDVAIKLGEILAALQEDE
ncbi:IclR family transcriptional regulator [Paracidobacterium acidisoli]|uniref:IclR family transcriptional regulator n=1 Tax=Paracidobacterium acidisoli TaxID=2303751 RepID=A0A372IUM7_9BACT|nr:IclR family transcriptional regulator [Paracidobacterium acidisoli]MBT9330123.1 IclR family transcriptional regulator [Paracidobacterium acidisoli]